jgi:Domain of unknown function (DUF4265)
MDKYYVEIVIKPREVIDMEHIKIFFEHNNSIDGAFGIESAWALPVGLNKFKLDNILFYAKEYALGDVVLVENRNDDNYVIGLIKESGHSTVRILFNEKEIVELTRSSLKNLGCDSELSELSYLVAVDVPPNINYKNIKNFLENGERQNKWIYEEACIAHNF